MSYQITLDARFHFNNGQTLLEVGGQTLNLGNLSNIQELRTLLWGLATAEIQPIAGAAAAQNPAPATAAPTMEDVTNQVTAAFQASADRAQQRFEQMSQTWKDAAQTVTGNP